MNTFFCSDYSREAGEDIIGSASNHQTYVLVECPLPWTSEAFHSKWIPENLQILIKEVKRDKLPIKFLLIANAVSCKVEHTTLLIYQRKEGLSNGYRQQEFKLTNIEQVAGVVKKWFGGGSTGNYEVDTNVKRDILVCTHGSYDKCCAKYGNPFYFYATATVSSLDLDKVRIWRSSHFGGHRFAPTAIDLPEGRYYGTLDRQTFTSILTRTGDVECLKKVYRGWGILPASIQVLERELLLRHGWNWFNNKVIGTVIEQNLDRNIILAELTVEKPDCSVYCYQAKLVKDETKTLKLRTSCNAMQESVFVKYAVESLWLASHKLTACSK